MIGRLVGEGANTDLVQQTTDALGQLTLDGAVTFEPVVTTVGAIGDETLGSDGPFLDGTSPNYTFKS